LIYSLFFTRHEEEEEEEKDSFASSKIKFLSQKKTFQVSRITVVISYSGRKKAADSKLCRASQNAGYYNLKQSVLFIESRV